MGNTGAMTELGYGWLTPVLSYLMAVLGSALALRCMVRARSAAAGSRARWNWLAVAAVSLGIGIWTMHFIAMLGFGVTGSEVHYDVLLTIASLLIAVAFTGAGALLVGRGGADQVAGAGAAGGVRLRTLLPTGLLTGFGIAAMHYVGMAAMRLHGAVSYDPLLVALSVLIAVVAATAALWAALEVRGRAAGAAAALVMGVAVSAMHYTGMAAMRVSVAAGDHRPLGGAGAMAFVFPLAVGLGSFLFLTSAFVALSPESAVPSPYRERMADPGLTPRA
jgi:NO-binding membrane sensor protein with MHYT domain